MDDVVKVVRRKSTAREPRKRIALKLKQYGLMYLKSQVYYFRFLRMRHFLLLSLFIFFLCAVNVSFEFDVRKVQRLLAWIKEKVYEEDKKYEIAKNSWTNDVYLKAIGRKKIVINEDLWNEKYLEAIGKKVMTETNNINIELWTDTYAK